MAALSAAEPLGDRLAPGRPWPLGAHWDGAGVNFALYSAHASRVQLCLFDDEGMSVVELREGSDRVWHGYLAGAAPGLRYAYRVDGPHEPMLGHRFAPRRLLLDPYARELSGHFSWDAGDDPMSVYGLTALVAHEPFDWGGDRAPEVPWAETVLYEVHVKGATRRHPQVPEALRGTYAGLAAPAMIAHYKRLGVTALNLLPVAAFIDEERLARAGRVNYWGYNPLAFFVPEPRYAAGQGGQSAVAEFRAMVRALHAEGIEVILDVVFNHTAETDTTGPTLSWRGIDNAAYYRLPADDLSDYENFTGCGNTLNLAEPRVLQLVMDALRYWVGEMRVDGFRFDLATTLARDSAFLAAIAQDPLLSRVKLIAEPWDLGPDGYRLGRFPAGWGEWNDRFRDDVRGFWLTGEADAGQLAQRLAGSSELFRRARRAPQAGINFITAHDGLTLHDLVRYQQKHNEANGEANHDGHAYNHSWNCGVEGESTDPTVRELRRRLTRALLATLFVAQGVPMLQAGDELGRTQAGNNNAYCQDNELTWLDWAGADADLIDYVAGLIALRRRFPQLRQNRWLSGETAGAGEPDVRWWHQAGREMRSDDWHAEAGAFGFVLAPVAEAESRGEAALLCLINRSPDAVDFVLPPGDWLQVCESSADAPFEAQRRGGIAPLAARSLQLLARQTAPAPA